MNSPMNAAPKAQTCPRCGTPLAAGGFCPVCVAGLALGQEQKAEGADFSEAASFLDLHDYELLGEIARGGMGVVFKARHRKLNRTVALKMIRSGRLAGPVELQRFRAEARAAALLQHPNIVTLHEAGEHNGLPYFAMEYVEGRTLAQLVEEGPISPKRAAAYLKSMAQAIHYAHQQGVLHRDLKPSNVLIDRFDQPRITDFGLAKQLPGRGADPGTQLTFTGEVLGTPGFMPPEQAAASFGEIGPASDVYSLGAILYFLLAARPPFAGFTLGETISQVLNSPPASPRRLNAGVPRDLETICLKCLEKDPRRRYASAQELADELGSFLDAKPILARPVGRLARSWRWCRRYPVIASLAGSLILTLLALALALLAIRKGKSPALANFLAQMGLASRPSRDFDGPDPIIIAIDGKTLTKTEVGIGEGVALDPTDDHYWAATLFKKGVIVRDGKTDRVLTNFHLGDCPGGVAIDCVHRLAWVTAQCGVSRYTNLPNTDVLWVIHADTYDPVTVPIGCGGVNGSPEIVNPATGRFYHNVGEKQRIDPYGGSQRICPFKPHPFVPTYPNFGPVMGISSNLLYAAGPSNTLQIVDGAPDPEVVLTNVPLPFPAGRVVVNPLRNCAYVCTGTNLIIVLDARTGQKRDSFSLTGVVMGITGVAVDPQQDRIFASAVLPRDHGALYVLQGGSNTVVELPAVPSGLVYNPVDDKIYVWGYFHPEDQAQK